MSNLRVARTWQSTEGSDMNYDLEIALSKARAARILAEVDGDCLQMPRRLESHEEGDVREWIRSFAFDALDRALEEAEVARAKILGPPRWGKRKVVAR